MDRYKHIIYNPKLRLLQSVLDEADNSWQFVRCQPVTEHEWVAIFEKWDAWENNFGAEGEEELDEPVRFMEAKYELAP